MFQKHLITFCAIVFALATFFYSPEPAIAAPSSPAGGGTLVEPVDITPFGKTRSPGGERVGNAIDNNDQSKFLNFHKTGSGFTVTFDKAVVVNEIEFTTANDDHGRDPIEVEISGSNQSPQSGFSKIADVPLTKIRERFAPYGNGFTNGTAYKYYRVVITDVDNRRRANSFQFAEVDFYSTGTPPMGADPGMPPTDPGAPGMPPTDPGADDVYDKMRIEKNRGNGYPDTCHAVYGNGGDKSLGTDHGIGERAVTNCIKHNSDYINTPGHEGGCGGLNRDQHFRTLAGIPITRPGFWNEDNGPC